MGWSVPFLDGSLSSLPCLTPVATLPGGVATSRTPDPSLEITLLVALIVLLVLVFVNW